MNLPNWMPLMLLGIEVLGLAILIIIVAQVIVSENKELEEVIKNRRARGNYENHGPEGT